MRPLLQDFAVIDRCICRGIFFAYRIQLFTQCILGLWGLVTIIEWEYQPNHIADDLSYLAIACLVSWVLEIGICALLSTTDLTNMHVHMRNPSWTIQWLAACYFINLFWLQGFIGVYALRVLEKYSWNASNVSVMLMSLHSIAKVVSYFIFFIVWMWIILLRGLPCFSHITRRVFQYFRECPLRKLCKENMVHEYDAKQDCVICLKPFADGPIVELPQCGHAYHESCIWNWIKIKTQCPLCRAEILADENTPLLSFNSEAIP